MRVEVVYAQADRQSLIVLDVEEGCSFYEAALRSRVAEQFPELDLTTAAFGLFGKRVENPHEARLTKGDRVEIYRPLLIDPKAVRRQRAEKNKSGGKE